MFIGHSNRWSRRWIRLVLLVLLMLSSSTVSEQSIPAVTTQAIAAIEQDSREPQATSAVYLPLVVQQQLPTAQQLIAAALKAGRIDYGTSLLYRAYALFSDPRLPQEFWGAGSSGEDERLFYEATEPLGSIPADVAAQLQPFLLRPDDPQSIFSAQTQPAAEAGSAPTALPCFRANKWAAIASTKPGVKIKVWARCAGTYEADILAVLGMAEGLWGPMTSLMDVPKPDVGGEAGGDSDDLDIYLLDPLGVVPRPDNRSLRSGALALAVSAPPYQGLTSSGYILLDRTQIGRPGLKSTLAHELFHILQKAHNYKISFHDAEEWWFVEASAEWAASHFAREEAAAEVHPRFTYDFQDREEPLHLSTDPFGGLGYHMYAAYIWPFFMEQERGARAIGAAWRAIAGAGTDWELGLAAIDAQLPFAEHFRTFALRNLNLELQPGNPITPRYKDLDPSFPDGAPPQPSANEFLAAHSPQAPPRSFAAALRALEADYYHFIVSGNVGQVKLDWSGLAPASALTVEAVVKTRGKGWEVRRLTAASTSSLCDVEEFWLVLANHATKLDSQISGDLKVHPLEALCACENIAAVESWTGTIAFSYSHTASDAEFQVDLNHSAHVSFQLNKFGTGSGGVGWVGPATGTASINDRLIELNNPPPNTSTIQGSGPPLLEVYGEERSRVVLNMTLTTCEYNFAFAPTINAAASGSGGSMEGPALIGSLHSGNRPVSGPTPTLSGSGTFPAHSMQWFLQHGGEAYVPESFAIAMFAIGLLTDQNAGAATVTWSFSPVEPAP
jgi:hypothetical protein